MNIQQVLMVVTAVLITGAVGVMGMMLMSSQRSVDNLNTRVIGLEQRLAQVESRRGEAVTITTPIVQPPADAATAPEPARETATLTGASFRGRGMEIAERLRDPNVPREEKLAEARDLLDSPFAPARLMGLGTMVRLGDEAALEEITEFVASAGEDRWSQRMVQGAIGMLAEVPGADPVLYDYFESDDQDIRLRAASTLELRGDAGPLEEVVSDFRDQLTDEDGGVRSRAVQALGRTGSSAIIPALEDAMGDDNSEVRMRVARAFGSTGDEVATVYLEVMLNDSVAEVRDSAAEALDEIRNPRPSRWATFGGPPGPGQ